jgi:transcriptional activator protein UGA3
MSKTSGFGDPDMGRDTRSMLSYYTQVLASLLTTTHDNNSFLSVFLPMAMDSPPLQKALIAWSAAHLSAYSKTHLVTALESRSSALLLVADALSAPILSYSESETILAACLVLCSTEVAFGDTSHWYQHLLGARQMISNAKKTVPGGEVLTGTNAFMKSRDGQWLLRNFAYHDVMGAVTTLEPPLIRGPYWLPPEDNNKPAVIDSYVGIGSKVLAILSEVCALNCTTDVQPVEQSTTNGVALSPAQDFWTVANDIETRLREWSCPDQSDIPLVELAESYRSASLIALYRKQRIYCQEHCSDSDMIEAIAFKLADAVDQTILHISLIPLHALTECGLLFPLFMAGGDTLKPRHIEMVRTRLCGLKEQRGFGNLGTSTEVLEELWRGRVNGYKGESGLVLDWLDVLRGKGWKLTLC